MSLVKSEFPVSESRTRWVYVFVCDGCGRVVRGRRYRGQSHRLAIDPPPAGWVETLSSGERIAWCRPWCEAAAVARATGENGIQEFHQAHVSKIGRALTRAAKKVLGLHDFEKAPWELDDVLGAQDEEESE